MSRFQPIEIPPHLLLSLDEALSGLPNIKPRVARRQLDAAYEKLTWKRLPRSEGGRGRGPAGARIELAPGAMLTFKDAEELFVRGSHTEAPRVTPEGAAVLIRLYDAGAFEPAKPRLGRADPLALRSYAESRSTLEAQAVAAVAAEQERAAQRRRWVTHPEEVPLSEFTPALLNEIFRTHRGPAHEDQMEIGGVMVRKTVHRWSSNARKTSDHEVTFTWIDQDGQPHSLGRGSRFAANRHNDPDRDWGLGRE